MSTEQNQVTPETVTRVILRNGEHTLIKTDPDPHCPKCRGIGNFLLTIEDEFDFTALAIITECNCCCKWNSSP